MTFLFIFFIILGKFAGILGNLLPRVCHEINMNKPITCGIFDSSTSLIIDSSTSYIDSDSFFLSNYSKKSSELFYLENKYKLSLILKSIEKRNTILENYSNNIIKNKDTFLNFKGDFVKILSSCDDFTYKIESELIFYISQKRKLENLISEYEEKIKLAS